MNMENVHTVVKQDILVNIVLLKVKIQFNIYSFITQFNDILIYIHIYIYTHFSFYQVANPHNLKIWHIFGFSQNFRGLGSEEIRNIKIIVQIKK